MFRRTAVHIEQRRAMRFCEVLRRMIALVVVLAGIEAAPVFWSSGSGTARAATQTTVTDYQYNDDGALAAVTTTVGDQAPKTTYLTWDNFVPDASDPTTGTVTLANGRLVGFGPSPGAANLSARFEFDPRDRLISYKGDPGNEIYDYHANGMMSSASVDGDALRFYYNTNYNPQATNIYQAAADLWSGYLARVRYLSDGTEEVLLKPHKDMACTYDAEAKTLQSYVYDAYGASPDGAEPLAGGYDLRDNPFRYAGEYRDPLWGGYYLRARWYHPDLQTFLSRDPKANLSRYGYGAGNPVMNVDPSGTSFKSFFGSISHALTHAFRSLDAKLTSGIGGHFARFFLSPLLGGLQILAYPKAFWKAVVHDQSGIDIFLALGVVSEVGGGVLDSVFAGFETSLAKRFVARTVSDLALGVGQSVAAGASRGFNHFDWNSFTHGLEYAGGAMLYRGDFNIRPKFESRFQLDVEGAMKEISKLEKADQGTALVFRQKVAIPERNPLLPEESTFQEAFQIGQYHERLVAVTKDNIFLNDYITKGVRIEFRLGNDLTDFRWTNQGTFELVARVEKFDPTKFWVNPRDLQEYPETVGPGGVPDDPKYSRFRNNCHQHAAAVLKAMGLR